MLVLEGRFKMPGEPGRGLLESVERHWLHITGGSRGLAWAEQMLARAIFRAILERVGGREADGRLEADLAENQSEQVALISEQHSLLSLDVEGMKARIEALEQAALVSSVVLDDVQRKIEGFGKVVPEPVEREQKSTRNPHKTLKKEQNIVPEGEERASEGVPADSEKW